MCVCVRALAYRFTPLPSPPLLLRPLPSSYTPNSQLPKKSDPSFYTTTQPFPTSPPITANLPQCTSPLLSTRTTIPPPLPPHLRYHSTVRQRQPAACTLASSSAHSELASSHAVCAVASCAAIRSGCWDKACMPTLLCSALFAATRVPCNLYFSLTLFCRREESARARLKASG